MPLALLVTAGIALAPWRGGATLEAAGAPTPDTDGDGLTNLQEDVQGTSPTNRDSDADGFPDLEEIARQSNPLLADSVPTPCSKSVGVVTSASGGTISAMAAVFVDGGAFPGLRFQWGIVIDGQPMLLPNSVMQPATTLQVLQTVTTHDPADVLITFRTAFPVSVLENLGSFAVVARVVDPAAPASDRTAAAVANLTLLGGVPASLEPAPASMQGGVVYRPLVRADDLPNTWISGEVCWQAASPVGMNGASTVSEVEAAACVEMDTYCNAGACSASVGTLIQMVDPGVLAGG